MSQRTRIRTTGAATPPPSQASSAQSSASATSSPKRRARHDAPGDLPRREPVAGESAATQAVSPASLAAAETHTSRRKSPAKRPGEPAVPQSPGDERVEGLGLGELGPEHLARALRAVASELERDPALAQRVSAAVYAPGEPATRDPQTGQGDPLPANVRAEKPSRRTSRAFTPRVVEGMSATLGPGILDPFAVRASSGEAGLRAALAELRLGSLRAIVREHQLDPEGSAAHSNDAERLRALILERVTRTKG